MKLSKFLKDIFFTGFSQVFVLLLGVLFLKGAAHILDKDNFGLVMIIRRWTGILLPFVTLSLGLSLTKYVSYQKEKERHYFRQSIGVVNGVFILLIIFAFLYPETASRLLFKGPHYSILAKVFVVYLYATALYTLIYSLLRGKQEMIRANLVNLGYFGISLFPVVVLWVVGVKDTHRTLLFLYGIYGGLVIIAALIYIIKQRGYTLVYPYRFKLKEEAPFYIYGAGRMPANLLLALLMGFPVLFANYRITLEVAGYAGISVAVIRMMEIFATPFNKIFLPKFSEFKGKNDTEQIKAKSMMVVDFIVTVVPTIVVVAYGLAKYVVIFWFGAKFEPAIPAVEIAILFSGFYIIYALLRGILNGIFEFPYVNIICFLGTLAVAALTVLAFNKTPKDLSMAFGIGLMILGVTSLAILLWKLKMKLPLKTLLIYLTLAAAIFIITILGDKTLFTLTFGNIYVKFLISVLYRTIIVLAVFFMGWKKTIWYAELKKRMNIRTGKTGNA
ncbi:MAG: lipopolysaccharide biosynthesis protein [bacterium]|nr:lipopolysaccharide biosynthesis protein [bacterium]